MSNDYLLESIPPVTYKSEHPLRELFADIIDDMDPEDRIVIEAVFFEGVALSELAHRLGLGARQSAHYRLNRALGLVKGALEEKGFSIETLSYDQEEE